MKALQKNDNWVLVPLLEGNKIVGCRCVFCIKHKADGSVERYKIRLVERDIPGHRLLRNFLACSKIEYYKSTNLTCSKL